MKCTDLRTKYSVDAEFFGSTIAPMAFGILNRT